MKALVGLSWPGFVRPAAPPAPSSFPAPGAPRVPPGVSQVDEIACGRGTVSGTEG